MHLSANHVNGCANRIEQTVEVSLGPDWAFETGNLGSLTRRVPASQVVCAVPPSRRKAKPHGLSKNPTPPQKPRGSSAAKFLRLAQKWRRQLHAGEVESQAAIARREDLTRARVTQILALLRLAPDIQKSILALTENPNPPAVSEAALRPITRIENAKQQVAAFEEAIDCRP